MSENQQPVVVDAQVVEASETKVEASPAPVEEAHEITATPEPVNKKWLIRVEKVVRGGFFIEAPSPKEAMKKLEEIEAGGDEAIIAAADFPASCKPQIYSYALSYWGTYDKPLNVPPKNVEEKYADMIKRNEIIPEERSGVASFYLCGKTLPVLECIEEQKKSAKVDPTEETQEVALDIAQSDVPNANEEVAPAAIPAASESEETENVVAEETATASS